ncbi:MAG TPA: alpha/beta hydrolase [Acidimicrobiales bacterium]|nr:alpha/beta hydrolase [Acidimicrobiales bacterium]
MQRRRIIANDVAFSYLEAGPEDGPLALCLHGFPDTAQTWRHLLPELAAAGFHAVAPWMRGYAPTDVPGDGRYQTGALATDACALHEALGADGRAVLIGHDWGAAAATGAAVLAPDRWNRVVTAALPPFTAMAESFLSFAQLKKSFYIFVFLTPMAEPAVARHDLSFIEGLWADWSPGYDGSWDVARVKEAIGSPANLSAAIGYYRAMFDPSLHDAAYADAQAATAGTPPQPTLYLHGTDDGAIGIEAVGDVRAHLSPGSAQLTVENTGHFLHLERPDQVNGHILTFLGSP